MTNKEESLLWERKWISKEEGLEIFSIDPLTFPFSKDDKIFNSVDEDGNIIGEKYSYNDWIKRIEDISGVSDL
jgi:hypothetical protein